MPGLRFLLRVAPFVVGAVAVGVWLRRRGAERKALPAAARMRELGVGAAVVGGANASKGEPVEPGGQPEPGRQPEPRGRPEPTGRFQRKPIDIVTVVDDLLQAGR
jgi:hypothetical protein